MEPLPSRMVLELALTHTGPPETARLFRSATTRIGTVRAKVKRIVDRVNDVVDRFPEADLPFSEYVSEIEQFSASGMRDLCGIGVALSRLNAELKCLSDRFADSVPGHLTRAALPYPGQAVCDSDLDSSCDEDPFLLSG